jgi:hypothetical protein
MSTLWPWQSFDAVARALLPTALQAEGLVAVFVAGLVMLVLGRAVLGARTIPEIALIGGWGLMSLVITLWGVTTPQSMSIPIVALTAIAGLAGFARRGRLEPSDVITIGRLLVLGLPLLAVMAASMPTQPDTFTNQLPNAVYLYDHGQFPANDRPPMLAVWPAFPYNFQIASLLPALLAQGFAPNMLTHLNLLLQFVFALLLARAMRGTEPVEAPPSWSAIGGALLLTTFLNPGFNPKIQFSGYADPAIAVAVPFAAWQAERLLAALADNRSGARQILALTFVALAGVAIKQVSVVLMAGVAGTAFLIGAFDARIGPKRAFLSLAQAFAPALLMVLAWRFYVAGHFNPDDELRLMPVSQWSLATLPAILVSMASQIWEKMPFFVMLYGVSLAAIPLALRHGLTPAIRLFLLTLGVMLLYTLFLMFTYVAHFPGEIGASAHSFFRYNTHLGLLATLAAVAYARESWVRRGAPDLGEGWQYVRAGAVGLAIAAPLIAAGWIRFDLRQPQPLVWNLAGFAAPNLHDGDRVALLLPGDNERLGYMLRVAIAMSPPRHALAHFDAIARADTATLDDARAKGDNYALVSCISAELAASPLGRQLSLPAGRAGLLSSDGSAWSLVGTYGYPPDLPPVGDWTAQLPPGPFCR